MKSETSTSDKPVLLRCFVIGDGSSLKMLSIIDRALSTTLSVCADKTSSFGSLRPLMTFLEFSCHGIPWIIGCIAGLAVSHRAESFQILVNLLLALVVDLLIVSILKLIFRRKRPDANLPDMFFTVSIDNYSFPSGHATRAALTACILLLRTPLHTYRTFIISWAAAVCLSRILLGRHHFFDVLCGVVIGILEYVIMDTFWLSAEVCLTFIRPFQEHFHI